MYREFCVAEYTQDNLSFWLDVEAFQNRSWKAFRVLGLDDAAGRTAADREQASKLDRIYARQYAIGDAKNVPLHREAYHIYDQPVVVEREMLSL